MQPAMIRCVFMSLVIRMQDELLEVFLETFPEESSMVQLQLVTATVKLFLKKPTEKPQQMIQLVLTYATQVSTSTKLRKDNTN